MAAPVLMEVHSQGSGRAFRESGTGDFSVAAKLALGPGDGPVEMAVLATVSFPTATRREFGSDSELYSLGATVAHAVGDTQSIALYANVDVLDGEATWTLSPTWSFSLGDSIGGYIEAGFQPAAHGTPASDVAGGGLTWLVRPAVQLDVYFLSGLTEESRTLGWRRRVRHRSVAVPGRAFVHLALIFDLIEDPRVATKKETKRR